MREQDDGNGRSTVGQKIEEVRTHLLKDGKIRESISARAYEIYQERGGEHGRHFDDWRKAEDEILTPLIEQELRASDQTVRSSAPEQQLTSVISDEAGQRILPEQPIKSGASTRRTSRKAR